MYFPNWRKETLAGIPQTRQTPPRLKVSETTTAAATTKQTKPLYPKDTGPKPTASDPLTTVTSCPRRIRGARLVHEPLPGSSGAPGSAGGMQWQRASCGDRTQHSGPEVETGAGIRRNLADPWKPGPMGARAGRGGAGVPAHVDPGLQIKRVSALVLFKNSGSKN